MRGLISPSVFKCMLKDPLWHQKYVEFFGGENGFDTDGYDHFGYNVEGYDRAGFTANDYAYKQAYDEEDFEYDEGCQNFSDVYNQFSLMSIDDKVHIPIKYLYVYEIADDVNVFFDDKQLWITEDGYFELN
jgi:hypothetical protein